MIQLTSLDSRQENILLILINSFLARIVSLDCGLNRTTSSLALYLHKGDALAYVRTLFTNYTSTKSDLEKSPDKLTRHSLTFNLFNNHQEGGILKFRSNKGQITFLTLFLIVNSIEYAQTNKCPFVKIKLDTY